MKEGEKKVLQDLTNHPGYEIMLKYLGVYIEKINTLPTKGPNEFETIWNAATKESKIEGLKDFFNCLEKQMF